MNEMFILGDRMIATVPELTIELLAKSSHQLSDETSTEVVFTIGDVKLYCSGHQILSKEEQNVAFYLVRFGTWLESESVPIIDALQFKGVRFSYRPELPVENQIFQMIGELSSMISAAFNERTIYERSVIALDTGLAPAVYAARIPNDYKGSVLPLWQFELRPNSDYRCSNLHGGPSANDP